MFRPFCNPLGGSVLNASINMFAHCDVKLLSDDRIEFVSLRAR